MSMRRVVVASAAVAWAIAVFAGCSPSDVPSAKPAGTKVSTSTTDKPGAAAPAATHSTSPECTATGKYLFAVQFAGRALTGREAKEKAVNDLKTSGEALTSAVPALGASVLAVNTALAMQLANAPAKGTVPPQPEAMAKGLEDLKAYYRDKC